MPSSTTHRLLLPWVHQDLLEHTGPKTYRMGPELFRLSALIGRKFEVQRLARPLLTALWKEWQETSVLCLFHTSTLTATVAESIPSPQPLKYELLAHSPVSLVWGSLGLAILAHLPAATIDEVLRHAQPGPISNAPLAPHKSILKALARIRGRRYALYHKQTVDVAGVSAAILHGDGRIVGSLGVILPASRFTRAVQARLPGTIVHSATALSNMLKS
ncbi:MAG TPA: IclR family transcriptional regulator C-terminal domain-containing protein [Steroidobacteraceae bacterium]